MRIRTAAAEHRVTYLVVDATDMHDVVARAPRCAAPATRWRSALHPLRMFGNFGHRGRVLHEAVAAAGAKRLDLG